MIYITLHPLPGGFDDMNQLTVRERVRGIFDVMGFCLCYRHIYNVNLFNEKIVMTNSFSGQTGHCIRHQRHLRQRGPGASDPKIRGSLFHAQAIQASLQLLPHSKEGFSGEILIYSNLLKALILFRHLQAVWQTVFVKFCKYSVILRSVQFSFLNTTFINSLEIICSCSTGCDCPVVS